MVAFGTPVRRGDVGIAEELFVELEGAQDGDAARQAAVLKRGVARVDGAFDRLFPGPACGRFLSVPRPLPRSVLVAAIVSVKPIPY